MGISLVELVDRLMDIGPYDQPLPLTLMMRTQGEEDREDSTTIESKVPKEEEFEEESGPRKDEEDPKVEPLEEKDPKEEPMEEDDLKKNP